jgi:hypothetical protein
MFVAFTVLLLLISNYPSPSSCSGEYLISFHEAQTVIAKIIETLRMCYNMMDTFLDLYLDHNNALALQARRFAIAETSGNITEYADAAFTSLYGDSEQAKEKQGRTISSGNGITLLESVWEYIRFEYYLRYYRRVEHRAGRQKRHVLGALNPRIADMELEISQSLSVGDDEFFGDGEPVKEINRFNPYIADIAYAFPIIDFFFPFDGTFHFFETEYSIYDLIFPFMGIDNL